MALLDDVISYGRICEPPEEIRPLLEAAEAYLDGAMECKDRAANEANPLYVLAVKMLVVHWYDNREPVGRADKLAFGLEAIITQLQNGGAT